MAIRGDILKKLHFCCEKAKNVCKNKYFPVCVFKRDVCLNLEKYNVSYVFCFCPWCRFHYYDLECVWNRDLREKYGMDVDLLEELGEWIEIPEEFDTDKWWINRQYFDLTLGYGSQRCVPISKTHDHGFCCDTMYELLDEEGHGSFRLYVKYIPNIKAYVILNKKKKYGGFESMDYCPFCGAKFPNRLDKELTKILREEYGLNSWQDYKKAPKEFHTDAWWKNRNLEERCFEYSLVS